MTVFFKNRIKQFKLLQSVANPLFIQFKPVEIFLLPTDAHNVKKHRVIKTF